MLVSAVQLSESEADNYTRTRESDIWSGSYPRKGVCRQRRLLVQRPRDSSLPCISETRHRAGVEEERARVGEVAGEVGGRRSEDGVGSECGGRRVRNQASNPNEKGSQ